MLNVIPPLMAGATRPLFIFTPISEYLLFIFLTHSYDGVSAIWIASKVKCESDSCLKRIRYYPFLHTIYVTAYKVGYDFFFVRIMVFVIGVFLA